ncbi:unnamed protein product, partial [marine sediment metagenome]
MLAVLGVDLCDSDTSRRSQAPLDMGTLYRFLHLFLQP